MIGKGQDSGAQLRHGHGLDITAVATTAYRVLFLRNVAVAFRAKWSVSRGLSRGTLLKNRRIRMVRGARHVNTLVIRGVDLFKMLHR
jgi:hypothetical protein